MRWLFIPIIGLALVACGQGPADDASDDGGPDREKFDRRAQEVAQAWQAQAGDWTTDFRVLDKRISGPDEAHLDEAQSAAISSGWYELDTDLPDATPTDVVTLDDTRFTLEVWDAATAYDNLATGGEPPADCPGESSGDSSSSQTACGVLTITAMEPDMSTVWTNHGLVNVPVWSYTAEGLPSPIKQVAFDIDGRADLPVVDAPEYEAPGESRGVTGLSEVTETTVTALIGVGACDENIELLVYEAADAIVVGGRAEHNGAELCTDQLLFKPVTAELSTPIGDRMIINASSGSVLSAAGPLG
ncbi:MAG TPA: hypothetical protein H9881_17120 [Candidatus Stackebrandtia excrementipullorum]|nr:hypothetical protein [Candidatus Stackebrandtia excrementipullorum]